MKRIIICCAVLLTVGLANGQTIISDNFESYSLGSWPAPWVADANAISDPAHNGIQTDPAGGGSKTLRLFGELGGCWAALAGLPFPYADSFEVELDVYNGNESLSGCHPDRAAIGLLQGVSWTDFGHGILAFMGDGNIYSEGQVLRSYVTLRWYHVKVVYTRNGSTLNESFWFDGVFAGTVTSTVNPSQQTALDHFELTVQEGSAWFDNVVIRYAPPLGIAVSQVEMCWTSLSNQNHQVQYRCTLTTNVWTDLGSPVQGDGGTKCATDAIIQGQPHRFYRVVLAP